MWHFSEIELRSFVSSWLPRSLSDMASRPSRGTRGAVEERQYWHRETKGEIGFKEWQHPSHYTVWWMRKTQMNSCKNCTRYWKPLAACLIWENALCLTCCHLNSELVASKDRYVSTLPDWGGGGWRRICLPQEEPPRPLRRPQNSPLALHTPRSCNLPRAAVGEEKGEAEFDRKRDKRGPRSLTYIFSC